MEIHNAIVDLEAHVTDGNDQRFLRGIPLVGGRTWWGLQSGKDIPRKILDRLHNLGRDGIVGLTNYNDSRAERVSSWLAGYARSQGYVLKESNNLLVIKRDERVFGFLQNQEIPTEEGDVLIVGKGNIIGPRDLEKKKPSLHEVLEEAKAKGALICAPRDIAAKLVEKNIEIFDCIGVWDGNYGEIGGKSQLGRRFAKTVYSTSDSHTPWDIAKSYTVFAEIDISSNETVIESLKYGEMTEHVKRYNGLVEGLFLKGRDEILRHGLSVLLGWTLYKSGLIKRE